MRRSFLLTISAILILTTTSVPATDSEVLTGVLTVTWGDPIRGEAGSPPVVFHLTGDAGVTDSLAIDPEIVLMAGGLQQIAGRRVRVTTTNDGPVRTVVLLEKLGAKAVTTVTGSQPWVSIMCKFPDVADEPHDLAFFLGMFDNSPGRLDHYWRETSYGNIDVVGSTAAGWVILPNNQTHYVPVPGDGCLDGDNTGAWDVVDGG
jgi:hypothetical protein